MHSKKSGRHKDGPQSIYDSVLLQEKWWSRLYSFVCWHGCDFKKIASFLLGKIPNDFSGSLLDIPAGSAVFTKESYAARPQGRFVCFHENEEILSRVRAQMGQAVNVACCTGESVHLPFSDASFDFVLSLHGFHSFSDKLAVLSETMRVLKQGGMFCGCCYARGVSRRADFSVKYLLPATKRFIPPYASLAQMEKQLREHCSEVELHNMGPIAYFVCRK